MSGRGNDKARMKALLTARLAYKKYILSGLKEYGIMPGHPKIMHYIMSHEGCRQKDIANNCYVESATLSSVLSNMERHGLIERRRSSDDKRSYSIYPKDCAKPIFDAVLDQFDKTESTLNDKFIATYALPENEKGCNNLVSSRDIGIRSIIYPWINYSWIKE